MHAYGYILIKLLIVCELIGAAMALNISSYVAYCLIPITGCKLHTFACARSYKIQLPTGLCTSILPSNFGRLILQQDVRCKCGALSFVRYKHEVFEVLCNKINVVLQAVFRGTRARIALQQGTASATHVQR